ncbi:MAG: Rrf2 family transcriptional regulator [Paenibacillaceae bacterium]
MNSEFTIAVHSLVLLAYHPGNMASSNYIAENVSTHPARVRKIMGLLKKKGYVLSKEGIGGGFILKADPDQVTLGEIYRVTSEGSLQPNWCSGDRDLPCVVASNIEEVMAKVFCNAEKHLSLFFDSLTISNVLSELKTTQTK